MYRIANLNKVMLIFTNDYTVTISVGMMFENFKFVH